MSHGKFLTLGSLPVVVRVSRLFVSQAVAQSESVAFIRPVK